MSDRCHHGMLKKWCSLCKQNALPQPPNLHPVKDERTSSPIRKEWGQSNYAVIQSQKIKGDEGYLKERLGPETTYIHICGHLFLWLIERILELAPNLKTLRVIPTALPSVGPRHRKLLQERGVTLVPGHDRPGMAWAGENRAPEFERQKSLLKGLTGEKKALFENLLRWGFEEALITARYFCLNGESYQSLRMTGQEFGISPSCSNYLTSRYIRTVLCYLKIDESVGGDAKTSLIDLQRKVARITAGENSEATKTAIAQEAGMTKLPDGLPPALWERFIKIAKAMQSDAGKNLDPRWQRVLTLRYGLKDFKYRSLEETTDAFGGITRSRIQQVEAKALRVLGIIERPSWV